MLEDFKQHPAIRPLISGGKLLEYSAHMVPEGGLAMVPQLVNEGVMIVGDAAGFCLNLGFTVRGMDLAIASAQAAATTVIAAKNARISPPAVWRNTNVSWNKAASCVICSIFARSRR